MSEIAAWLDTLDPVFLFLLALPFAVAAAGLAAEAMRGRRATRGKPERARTRASIRREHPNIG